jgi:hypothetical protein
LSSYELSDIPPTAWIPVTGLDEVTLHCQFCANDEPHVVLMISKITSYTDTNISRSSHSRDHIRTFSSYKPHPPGTQQPGNGLQDPGEFARWFFGAVWKLPKLAGSMR